MSSRILPPIVVYEEYDMGEEEMVEELTSLINGLTSKMIEETGVLDTAAIADRAREFMDEHTKIKTSLVFEVEDEP